MKKNAIPTKVRSNPGELDQRALEVAARSLPRQSSGSEARLAQASSLQPLDEREPDLAGFGGDHDVVDLPPSPQPESGTQRAEHCPSRITLYVTEQGALIRVRGDRLRVDWEGQSIAAIPFARVRQIVCVGRIGMTTPLLHRAVAGGVDVIILTSRGRYVGRLSNSLGSNIARRKMQYSVSDNPSRALGIATQIVGGKIANMRVVLLRTSRGRRPKKAPQEVLKIEEKAIKQLERAARGTPDATSHAALMGMEGAASRSYFRWWALRSDLDWHFEGRKRRPPPDPINALLSYGYALLLPDSISACQVAGLDPDVGMLHADRWGRPSLALDLALPLI